MKSPTTTILAIILAIFSLQAFGQHENDYIAGSWQGVLNTGNGEIRLVFNISFAEDNSFKATLDSPDQGARDIPLGEVSVTEDSIRIEAPIVNGFYLGELSSDSSISGEWHQAGRSLILDLEKGKKAIVLNRPQEPHPPFPYKEEDVTFQNSEQGFSLGGTLTLPEGEGPYPAAILVTGSGSQNRDEEIFGHKPFKLIADHLTRKGFAVLRYDDRGVASSGGSLLEVTTGDFAGDARSAIDYLFKRSEIDHSKIGVIGHSEGGMIAFMLASSYDDIAFVITLAGPGVDGKTILLEQSDYIASLSGVQNSILEDNRYVMSNVYEIMIANESYEVWEEEVLKFTSKFYSEKGSYNYSEEDIERGKNNLLSSIPESSYAWMRYFVMFDPAPLFGTITCPVLALNGKKDCQVLAEQNIRAIKNGLVSAGNADSKIMILPGLNHLFQNCETGLPNEYGIIEETFDQKTLDILSDWIQQQVD
jgi:pimeloyl-ACP methyl ester carboxylesterase